jgi:UDP-glucose 4-epimerase
MAVLVTGGAGYIGSVATARLLEAGESVVVLDSLATGHREAVSPGAEFIEGDLLDRPLLDDLFATRDIDTVMHFAAFSLVGESCENPGKYFRNNVEGSHTLLQAMLAGGARRFILSSTAATYGDPEAVPITEEAPTRPLNPYGLSKRMIEQMLEWYDRAHGFRFVALRYFNAAGATAKLGEDHSPETHLIPNVMMAASGLRPSSKVFGKNYDTPDGTCLRDYIHVDDLISAHLLAMKHLRAGGDSEILNLGNEQGTSVLDIIDSVKRITGKDFPVEFTERRPGDADRLVASSAKAQRVLGWKPVKGDIDTIVRDAWSWREAHPRGYAG